MKHTITLLSRDGIGPKVSQAVVEIIATTGVDIHWESQLTELNAIKADLSTLPE